MAARHRRRVERAQPVVRGHEEPAPPRGTVVRGGALRGRPRRGERVDGHDEEPMRFSQAGMVGLVARLASGRLLPLDSAHRAAVMGAVEVVAGEGGVGWKVRPSMVLDGLTSDGPSGFPVRVAEYLAKRHGTGTSRRRRPAPRKTVPSTCSCLSMEGGTNCPGSTPSIRAAFTSAASTLGSRMPERLRQQRARKFAGSVSWPIRL